MVQLLWIEFQFNFVKVELVHFKERWPFRDINIETSKKELKSFLAFDNFEGVSVSTIDCEEFFV